MLYNRLQLNQKYVNKWNHYLRVWLNYSSIYSNNSLKISQNQAFLHKSPWSQMDYFVQSIILSSSNLLAGMISSSSISLFIVSRKKLSSKTRVRCLSRSCCLKSSKYSEAQAWTEFCRWSSSWKLWSMELIDDTKQYKDTLIVLGSTEKDREIEGSPRS